MGSLIGSLGTGCWGYNSSSKGWSYVGNTLLLAGGGGAIALDRTSSEADCTGTSCAYKAPISGMLVAGIVVATAGLFGILFTATRTEVKGSR